MSPEQEQAAKWIVPIAITLVVTFALATVAEVTNDEAQVEPALVQVPCNPDQFVGGDPGKTLCYDSVGNPTEAQGDTLLCNESFTSDADERAAKERGIPYCDHAELIPEAEEQDHGIPQAAPPVAE